MPTRPITDSILQIVDREDWFGENSHANVIRFMMASTYAMSQFYQLYGQTPDIFIEGPCRNIARALFGLYKQTGRVIAINPGRRARIDTLYQNYFSKINDPKECERTKELFIECLDEVKRNLHYYANKRDVRACIEQSQMMFAHARAEILADEIQNANASIDVPADFVKAVNKSIENYQRRIDTSGRKLTFGSPETVQVLERALAEVEHPLFTLPERLGPIATMMNAQFVPSGFISFMGPEKRGKSWWLQELAINAARQVPTLYIQAGDMSTEMVLRRILTRLLKRSHKEKYCGELFIPVLDCGHNQKNTCNKERRCNHIKTNDLPDAAKAKPRNWLEANPDYVPCAECARCGDRAWLPAYWWKKRNPVEPFTLESSIPTFEKVKQSWRGCLDIVEYPNDTLTLSTIHGLMEASAIEGKQYKVIVLDYMDLLAKQKGNSNDYRHFQNELWKGFRGLLQEFEACGIVATQANSTSQDCDYIDMGQISEDKRKASHVTAMWGLNQTKQEKQKGIMRVNQVVVRDDEFDTRQQIAVLQCLAIGQPILGSYIIPDYTE